MRKAVIDLGTNTFNLLIVDVLSGEVLHNQKMPVHLGRGGLKDRILREDSIQRGIIVLRDYLDICRKTGVVDIRAVACSAVRSAENKQAFVNAVHSELGLDVEVLSGIQEAEYIYRGINHAVKIESQTLVMDIGGGSTELIMCDESGVNWLESYDLGVSRILEVYEPSDPITYSQIENIRNDIKKQWENIPNRDVPHILIGSSGSFDTMAGLYLQEQGAGYNGLEIPLEHMQHIAKVLLASTEQERRNMRGMDISRIPHIHLSGLLVQIILEIFNIERILLSQFALKEGVLFGGE
jgi:exopolyphosphatase / guanosine-5'-triphosphate,3'-diphosphate pyrophosphatase